ncbi:MAG: BON domain-containing protein [Chloroflexi bacterium]|nr:BON domain-containing protein [Chloroflexota bacterium]
MYTPTMSDATTQQAVLSALLWDPSVDETRVGVTVENGIVTLTGTAATNAQRVAAHQAAHRVAGVLDVANEIRVEPPGSLTRTDLDIAQAVRQALEWNMEVPAQIVSTVTNGWVTLEGEVRLLHEREEAERAVRNHAGVRGVTNKITVAPHQVDAAEIATEIQAVLERRAERAAHHIQVKVDGDTVTLTGPVRTWTDRRAIIGATKYTAGVREIVDQLRLDPNA